MNSTALRTESFAARVARGFFTHSGHVPLVLLILEALLARPGYFLRIDPYLLLAAGVFQAWLAEWLAERRPPWRFLANFAGPLFYSLAEVGVEGARFFLQSHHQAYWGFAFGFAVLQWAQAKREEAPPLLVLAENILRSAIPLVMYALFEARTKDNLLSLDVFFSDSAHTFLSVVLLLLGALLGFADINLRRSLATIRSLAERLHRYSAWSLGQGILDRAIADEAVLSLQRVERAVLFMDIRGFTAWSERQAPEAIVGMLDGYYRASEGALDAARPIKVKFTADEVMAVFPDAAAAIDAGARMLAAVRAPLAAPDLAAGAGVHWGPVVEGVLGGEGAKAYDFIGDTVNTAQRLCDAAMPGELMVSDAACAAAGMAPVQYRDIAVKGKREPLKVAALSASPP